MRELFSLYIQLVTVWLVCVHSDLLSFDEGVPHTENGDCLRDVLDIDKYQGNIGVSVANEPCVTAEELFRNVSNVDAQLRRTEPFCRAKQLEHHSQPWCLINNTFRQYDYCDPSLCHEVGKVFVTFDEKSHRFFTLNTPYLHNSLKAELRHTLLIFKLRGIGGVVHLRHKISEPYVKLHFGFDSNQKRVELSIEKDDRMLESHNLPWKLSPLEWRGFRIELHGEEISLRDENNLHSILQFYSNKDIYYFSFSSEIFTEWLISYPTCYSLIGFGGNLLQPISMTSGIYFDIEVTGVGTPLVELVSKHSNETYQVLVDRKEMSVIASHPTRNRAKKILMPGLSQTDEYTGLSLTMRYNKGLLVIVLPFDEQNAVIFNSNLVDVSGIKLRSMGTGDNTWLLNCLPGARQHCHKLKSSNEEVIEISQAKSTRSSVEFYVAGNGPIAEILLSPWIDQLQQKDIFRIRLWVGNGIYMWLGSLLCKMIPYFEIMDNISWTHYRIDIYLSVTDKSYITLLRNSKEIGRCHLQRLLNINFVGFFSQGDVVLTQEICDDCQYLPCAHNSSICNSTFEGGVCVCEYPFEGRYCDKQTDFCADNPCEAGNCSYTLSGYQCKCPLHRTGRHCEALAFNCLNHHCMNGGRCIIHGQNVECKCPKGFTGNFCADRALNCEIMECMNGGTCSTSSGSPQCRCPPHVTGMFCEKSTMRLDEQCNKRCLNNGLCYMRQFREMCHCPKGFSGMLCEIENPCECHNNGLCVGVKRECSCRPHTYGDKCQYVKSCYKNPCGNYGKCKEKGSSYKCFCKAGFYGKNCTSCNGRKLCSPATPFCLTNGTNFRCSSSSLARAESNTDAQTDKGNSHWYIVVGCIGILTIITILATSAFFVTRTGRFRTDFVVSEFQRRRSDEHQIVAPRKMKVKAQDDIERDSFIKF